MRVSRRYKGNEERQILAAMIIHGEVLERIVSHLRDEKKPFRSKWSNVIARWCVDYFTQYKKAPYKSIQNLFTQYAASATDNEAVETIEGFLSGLSEEYGTGKNARDNINADFVVDLASTYFRRVKLERIHTEIEGALTKNDVAFAEEILRSYEPVAFGAADWIDPTSPEVVAAALKRKEQKPLIFFRGDMERFLTPHFERGSFISFVGPEKRGKSYWLMEVVWMAWLQRRRVLYYVIGDMSQDEVMTRLITRAIHRPLKAGRVLRPVKLKKSEGKAEVDREEREFSEDVSVPLAVKTMKKILARTGSSQSRLKLRCVGGSTLKASDIEQDVKNFAREGWVPDLVVADYADLLEPEDSTRTWDYRHQINESWKIMRRIALEGHLLFVTATQAAASSYGANTIKKSDFSEDKRKNAHVSGMLGINQTVEEKAEGLYRLNWVFLRDGRWTESQVCWTAGSLDLACPCILSRL